MTAARVLGRTPVRLPGACSTPAAAPPYVSNAGTHQRLCRFFMLLLWLVDLALTADNPKQVGWCGWVGIECCLPPCAGREGLCTCGCPADLSFLTALLPFKFI